jgi:hypothetical protein
MVVDLRICRIPSKFFFQIFNNKKLDDFLRMSGSEQAIDFNAINKEKETKQSQSEQFLASNVKMRTCSSRR